MKNYLCFYELERWGEFLGRTVDGLGYANASPLSWVLDGRVRNPSYRSKIPKDVLLSGFSNYLLVEQALASLDPEYRRIAIIEHAAPITAVGKTMTRRASFAGITISMYRKRLFKIHMAVCSAISQTV